MDKRNTKREHWGSSIGFVLAMAGSAIGLGNIWKFPYVTGVNGGGAFVLIYLICILIVGIPVMICELAIGRNAQKGPAGAMDQLADERSRLAKTLAVLLGAGGLCLLATRHYGFALAALSSAWLIWQFGFKTLGWLQVGVGMLILSYYGVVGGWAVAYVVKSFSGALNFNTPEAAGQVFGEFFDYPLYTIAYQMLFMLLCALVLWQGVKKGIEKWSKILMPLMLFLLLAVIIRSVTLPGAQKGVEFFLKPDFSKLSGAGVLEALGHAFFTLSIGMGIIITYGSYLNKKQNLFTASLSIVALDTLASVMAGLAIFPAVFAMGFNPAAGPSLLFEILPATIGSFPGQLGWLWNGLFFLMLTIAALTSGLSLLEIGVSFLMDQFKMRRHAAVLLSTSAVSLLGILSAVSIASWNRLEPVKNTFDMVFGAHYIAGSFFDTIDTVCSNWVLPLSGLLAALFVGWVWGPKRAGNEIRRGARGLADVNLIKFLSGAKKKDLYGDSHHRGLTLLSLWAILVRFVAPVVILAIFLRASGLLWTS